MLCPKCTAEIADDSISCNRCGYQFVHSTSAITLDTTGQEKQIQKVLIVLFLGLAFAGFAAFLVARRIAGPRGTTATTQRNRPLPVQISQPIAPPQISVSPGKFAAFPFAFPNGCRAARVQGSFASPPGSRLQLLIFRESDFQLWKSRQKATTLYQNGSISHGNLALAVSTAAGPFELVVSNPASTHVQVLQADLKLYCSQGLNPLR